MPINKLLNRIRVSIEDLSPALEPFTDTTIQPGVEDCSELQGRVHELLELLGAYKYTKQNNEISPSFNIHAHISESVEQIKQEAVPIPEPPVAPAAEESNNDIQEKAPAPPAAKNGNGNGKTAKPLHIGINDKFRFINELFAHNDAEYNIAIEQLSNLQAWPETELYLASLKNLYEWKDNHEAVKYFYSIVKRRFQ